MLLLLCVLLSLLLPQTNTRPRSLTRCFCFWLSFFFFLSWDIGVAGMKIGERRRLVLPSKVAYGAAGAQPVIPPHADLVFEVELVKVNNKTK